MVNVRRTVVVVTVLAFAFCAHHVSAEQPPPQYWDPLLWAHLIVRGVVEEVTWKIMPASEWLPASSLPEGKSFAVGLARVRIADVLKGKAPGPVLDVWALDDDLRSLLDKGQQVVVCCYFNPQFHHGIYLVYGSYDFYALQGGRWIRGVRVMSGVLPPPPGEKLATSTLSTDFSLAEIMDRVRQTEAPALARAADCVAIGVVSAVGDTIVEGQSANVVSLATESTLKGPPTVNGLTFVMTTNGRSFGTWASYLPWVPTRGQRLFVFLKRGSVGLYAFAGINSVLQLDGDRVVVDRVAQYGRSVN